jgi:glycine/D-amino acid oxidase-like deaminating enzyme
VFGLSVAWACAKRGARVRVVDPEGVGAGASGGIVGALAPHVPEQWNAKKAFQLESLLMAGDWWAEVAEVAGRDPGYGGTGRVQPLADAAAVALARERIAGAADLWRGKAIWEVVSAPCAGLPPSPTGLYVHDTLSARIHPRRAVEALAAAVGGRGGEVVAEGPEEGPVVWATGYRGLQEMSEARGRLVGVGVKGQAALFAADRREMPQLFVDGLHVVPHADGTLAVGSTTEREWEGPARTDALADDLVSHARRVVPWLGDSREIARWAGVRPRSKTRAPMLGAWPGRPRHFIANGGFKIGFGMAPLAGEMMAELLLEGRNRVPADFDPALSF